MHVKLGEKTLPILIINVSASPHRLRVVADEALELGSPEVFVIRADVAKVEECKRVVDEAVNHFGQRKYPSKEWLLGNFSMIRFYCSEQARQPYVLPGLIESEITVPDSMSDVGHYATKFLPPFEPTKQCAEAIVQSACRGDMYLTEPSWWNALSMLKLLRPELVQWFCRWNFMNGPKSKQL
uniref:Uncharacterized protein n=1 Tax=Salix viminalis TaxID=40686 RepID=A0A6N2N5H7_SALVM